MQCRQTRAPLTSGELTFRVARWLPRPGRTLLISSSTPARHDASLPTWRLNVGLTHPLLQIHRMKTSQHWQQRWCVTILAVQMSIVPNLFISFEKPRRMPSWKPPLCAPRIIHCVELSRATPSPATTVQWHSQQACNPSAVETATTTCATIVLMDWASLSRTALKRQQPLPIIALHSVSVHVNVDPTAKQEKATWHQLSRAFSTLPRKQCSV